ncbi:MAG: hypothetical protein OEW24_02440 [Chloroflexota bacterium]|nr:hypothetical protein [Chloroflexota bacterium]
MSDEVTPIARLRLARSPVRVLAAPLVFALAGAAASAGGWMLGGIGGAGLAIAGALVVGSAIFLALFVFSVSVAIEPGTVHLRWLTGERRYALVRGSLTRITVQGPDRATVRARFGAFGWSLGRAVLRGQEHIDVVRLAATPTMIVIPTDLGRLAIAAASETELIEALGTAARMQQRTESASAARPPVAVVVPAVRLPEPPPRPLTGIERALLEERLAAERAAAEASAASERLAAAELAKVDAPTPQPTVEAVAPPAPSIPVAPPTTAIIAVPRARLRTRPRERAAWRRPSWLHLRRRGPGPAPVAMAAPATAAASDAAPRVSARTVVRPRVRIDPAMISEVLVLGAPLAAAAAVWIAWVIGGAIFSPTDGRLLTLALALGGIGGALGAAAARAWYPRLGPLVSMTAVSALALVARAAIA